MTKHNMLVAGFRAPLMIAIFFLCAGSPSIMAAITEREARLREITNQVVEPGPDSVKEKLDELRDFAVSRLTHLRERLADPKAIHEARALLAEQIGKFTLERVSENGRGQL